MTNAVEKLSQDVGHAQADIQNIKETVEAKSSKSETESAILKSELRVEERINVLTRDFSLTKINRVKFVAIFTIGAATLTLGAFWHFRGEIKSDNAELQKTITEAQKAMLENQAKTDRQLADLAVQIAQTNQKLGTLSTQISGLSSAPNLAGP